MVDVQMHSSIREVKSKSSAIRIVKYDNSEKNGDTLVEYGLFVGGEDGEHNGIGFLEISTTFSSQIFFGTEYATITFDKL